MRTIKLVISLARAATRLSATTRRATAVLALAMFSGLAVNATDYYLVGAFNSWTNNSDGYKLERIGDTNEYKISRHLTAGEFKVRDGSATGNQDGYFPNVGSNANISTAGYYTIYFRPNYDGDNNWHEKCIYIKDMNYYIAGTMNSWTVSSGNQLQESTNEGTHCILNVSLQYGNQFKVIHSYDGNTIDGYCPSQGDDYEVTQEGTYDIYFDSYYSHDNWHGKCINAVLKTAKVPVANEGYGTYFNWDYDATLPSGVKAKIVTGVSSAGNLTYETIADGDSNGKTVPGRTAVLLQVEASAMKGETNNKYITLNMNYNGNGNNTQNKLHGSDKPTTTSGGDKYYKLSYNSNGSDIGWYWDQNNGAAFESGIHKAWLALSNTEAGLNQSRGFFDLSGSDETTGISATRIENNDNWYSIDGRRLTGKPSQRGVYINNGKKLIIK